VSFPVATSGALCKHCSTMDSSDPMRGEQYELLSRENFASQSIRDLSTAEDENSGNVMGARIYGKFKLPIIGMGSIAIVVALVTAVRKNIQKPSVNPPSHGVLELDGVNSELVLNTGKDCWAPCGNAGGDCPHFCGKGNACCRNHSLRDPPECFGVTKYLTSHHECVAPLTNHPVKHAGQDCWALNCSISGHCDWCGTGNACCRYGAKWDAPECLGIRFFPTKNHHTCVASRYRLPVYHWGQSCWDFCGQKAGFCDWCGEGNMCCKHASRTDPQECRFAKAFSKA